MPSWEIHLEIATKLNEKLNYTGNELELFLIGNILPDVNNGHLLENISKKIRHRDTHFTVKDYNSYMNFFDKYQHEISESPLLLGYYVHLYLDYYWNHTFYNMIGEDVTQEEHDRLNKLKQDDFRIYGYNFYENNIKITDFQYILNECEKIDEIHITVEDLMNVEKYFVKRIQRLDKYKMYKKEELDEMFRNSISNLLDIIKRLGII